MMDYTFDELMHTIVPNFMVGHIVPSDFYTCQVGQPVESAFAGFQGISQLGVLDKNSKLVGLVEWREANRQLDVEDCTIRLADVRQVDFRLPLVNLLDEFAGTEEDIYRLTRDEGGAYKIVTISDFNKLPMKVLTYAYVAHLEKQLQREIRGIDHLRDDAALSEAIQEIHEEEWERLLGYYKSAREQNGFTTLLDATTFSQKVRLLELARFTKDNFSAEMAEIGHLRNWVSHTSPLESEPQTMAQLKFRFQLVNKWIGKLRREDKGAV